MTSSNDQVSYEALYARMQDIVARLEQGGLPLDEAVALYEEGIRVASQCQGMLETAELRVQELLIGGARSASEE